MNGELRLATVLIEHRRIRSHEKVGPLLRRETRPFEFMHVLFYIRCTWDQYSTMGHDEDIFFLPTETYAGEAPAEHPCLAPEAFQVQRLWESWFKEQCANILSCPGVGLEASGEE